MSNAVAARIVAYIDPSLKKKFYIALKKEDLTYKEWLVREATKLCDETEQPRLKFGK